MVGLTGAVRWAAVVAALVLCGAGLPFRAFAEDVPDAPIPSNAKEAYSPIGEGFTSPIEPREGLRANGGYVDGREALLAPRRERWRDAPSFFRDTALVVNSRTFVIDEDQFGFDEPKAFTTGGSLVYQSGYAADFFQLRSVLYTSQPLSANSAAGETDNLSPDGDGITTLGQINARVKLAGQEISVGRQLVRTPFINPFDVRMIPYTFEGVVLLPENGSQTVDYIASYLTRYKPRDDTNFIPFSEGLGVAQDEGVLTTGVSYRTDYWNVGFSNFWIKDTLNTAYGEIDHLLPTGRDEDGLSFRFGANYLDQRTVGADLIAGAPYETYQVSARFLTSYQGFVLTGAVSQVGSEADIETPFGFGTTYTAMFVTNFVQAGVRAYLARLSYDLGKLGFAGVKLEAAWGKGFGTPNLINQDFADQEELDLRFVYEPHRGPLEGLRVEFKYIDWQVFENPSLPSDDLTQFRAIVNYTIPLL